MQINFEIDHKELVKDIAQEVIKSLKPNLKVKAEDDRLYSVKSLAKYLGVSDQWVYERIKFKEIPHIKIGKFPRFKKADINKWLEEQKVPAINPLSGVLKALK
jgi:excisionase family DNA binding protein